MCVCVCWDGGGGYRVLIIYYYYIHGEMKNATADFSCIEKSVNDVHRKLMVGKIQQWEIYGLCGP